jgi:hypothetical protein
MTRQLLWVALLALAAGCGPSTGTISGTVTFKGEPVPSGTVSFLSAGKIAEGEIHDGLYEVARVPVGDARITVVRLDPKRPDPYEALNRARQRMIETGATDLKTIDPNIVTDAVQLDALQKQRHLLPFAYSRPEKSGLRFTVVAGPHTFDIPLSEKPNPQ